MKCDRQFKVNPSGNSKQNQPGERPDKQNKMHKVGCFFLSFLGPCYADDEACYIGHYRDPSKHDNSTHSSFGLPISRRAKAAWFTPSTVNSIISKVSTTSPPPLPHEAATFSSSSSSSEAHQGYDTRDPSFSTKDKSIKSKRCKERNGES